MQNNRKGDFRAKLQLHSNCGDMIVKYRVAVAGGRGEATLWGRSAS